MGRTKCAFPGSEINHFGWSLHVIGFDTYQIMDLLLTSQLTGIL